MFPDTEPTILIRIPLPHVDIDADKLYKIKDEFGKMGETLKIVAEDEYPCAASWAEIAINAGAFFGGTFFANTIAKHYIDLLLKAFDGLLKKGYSLLSLTLRGGNKSVVVNVPLEERALAISILEAALFELKQGVDGNVSMMYWLEKSKFKNANELCIYYSKFSESGGHQSGIKTFKSSDPEFGLWKWLVENHKTRMIDETAVKTLREDYQNKKS